MELPPLADLHRHLDGSLRESTLHELAAQQGVGVPADLAFHPGMGLEAALGRFRFTLSLLQEPEAVRRVAAEICEDADLDGVSMLEIRFAPQLHGGADAATIVDAALDGIAGRAGLLLCGLYGEPPRVLEQLVAIARERSGVVGIDLAGGPAPHHDFGMRAYAEAFQKARAAGLGRTVHAGEGRPAAEIRCAIEELGAQRIGHGNSLLDDPALLALVVDAGVTIEACPTSNLHTGVIASLAEHPLARWLREGVRACICPDNTLLSQVSASQEYERALSIEGMTPDLLALAISHGHAGAFAKR